MFHVKHYPNTLQGRAIMPFEKKPKPEEDTPVAIEASFGTPETTVEVKATPVEKEHEEDLFGVLPRFSKDMREDNVEACTVLYGYGVDAPDKRNHVDNYTFIGGVCRNVPRTVARAWKTGKRWQDGKPAISRIYLQAILPNDATEVDFAKATGVQPMDPARLAAMIGATDAAALVKALGAKQAAAFMEEIRKHIAS